MRILLATSLLPLFTIVAGAQINAGPFAIVDENGKLVGGANVLRAFGIEE